MELNSEHRKTNIVLEFGGCIRCLTYAENDLDYSVICEGANNGRLIQYALTDKTLRKVIEICIDHQISESYNHYEVHMLQCNWRDDYTMGHNDMYTELGRTYQYDDIRDNIDEFTQRNLIDLFMKFASCRQLLLARKARQEVERMKNELEKWPYNAQKANKLHV